MALLQTIWGYFSEFIAKPTTELAGIPAGMSYAN